MAAYDGPLEPLAARSLEKTAALERILADRKPEHADVHFLRQDPTARYVTVHAEVVSDPRDLRHGLMFRDDVLPGQGMLFKFPDRGRHSMWMKHTPLSLDMIFMDKDGKVVDVIKETDPFSEKTLTPGEDNDWVLETPAGFARNYQIRPGVRFVLGSQPEKTAVDLHTLAPLLGPLAAIPPSSLAQGVRRLMTPSGMAEPVIGPVITTLKNLGHRLGITPVLEAMKGKVDKTIYKELLRRQRQRSLAGFLREQELESRFFKGAAEQPKVLDGPDKTIEKTKVQGIPVNIERPKGDIKMFPEGYTQFYKNDYGSIPLAKGVDGDPLDVFVGPDKGSTRAFILEKMKDKDHSKFDEYKVMLGFPNRGAARESAKFHLWGTDGKIREVAVGTLQKALGVQKQAAEFAPGIPEKGRFADIPVIQKPTMLEFGIQKHVATRAGSHLDLRIGDPATGDAHSWALKKLPEPGKGTYAPMQPTHAVGYMDFEGEIPSGTYGAGTVELTRRGKAEVVKASPGEIRFNVYEGRVPEQFVLKRRDGRMWTLNNVTPARWVKKWEKLVPRDKPSLKEIPFSKLDPTKADEVYQPKLDGAHAIAVMEGGKPVRLFSYREAKNPTGLIEHTHRMPGWWNNTAPEGMKPTVIRGEIYATDKKGKPLPAAQVGGLLNTSVPESRKQQEEKGIKMRFAAFDVDRHEGKRVGLDPERTEQILTDISRQVPGIEVMPSAKTPAEKARLVAVVSKGKHPLTREGIVARSVETGEVTKAKLKSDYDVFIRQVYAGAKPGEAGGFRFSHTQRGPVVGNVGGGFKRTERREMLLNPERWIGRVAKVEAEQRFPSGALRAPVFKEPHTVKGLQPYHELD